MSFCLSRLFFLSLLLQKNALCCLEKLYLAVAFFLQIGYFYIVTKSLQYAKGLIPSYFSLLEYS